MRDKIIEGQPSINAFEYTALFLSVLVMFALTRDRNGLVLTVDVSHVPCNSAVKGQGRKVGQEMCGEQRLHGVI